MIQYWKLFAICFVGVYFYVAASEEETCVYETTQEECDELKSAMASSKLKCQDEYGDYKDDVKEKNLFMGRCIWVKLQQKSTAINNTVAMCSQSYPNDDEGILCNLRVLYCSVKSLNMTCPDAFEKNITFTE